MRVHSASTSGDRDVRLRSDCGGLLFRPKSPWRGSVASPWFASSNIIVDSNHRRAQAQTKPLSVQKQIK